MLCISNRGNIFKRIETRENHPDYITKALKAGLHVKIDLWLVENKLYLGKDINYEVKKDFILNNKLLIRARNFRALSYAKATGLHCFWLDNDKYTFTSMGIIWAAPGYERVGCISYLPETRGYNISDIKRKKCYGVCSDVINNYMI